MRYIIAFMNDSDLGKKLKNLREKNGYLQKFVADKLGIRSNTLSGYENGSRSPDPQMLVKLANLYKVSTDYLLGNKKSRYNAEDIEKAAIIEKIANEFPDADLMFKDLEGMSAEDMEEVYNYIKY